jgi:hypothetical protein
VEPAATSEPWVCSKHAGAPSLGFRKPWISQGSQLLFLDAFRNDLQPLNVETKSHLASQAKNTVYSRLTAIAQRSSAIMPKCKDSSGPVLGVWPTHGTPMCGHLPHHVQLACRPRLSSRAFPHDRPEQRVYCRNRDWPALIPEPGNAKRIYSRV